MALLSVTEAATKAGLSTPLIRKALAEGKIRGVKIDHSWIVDEGSLDAFVASPRPAGRPVGRRTKRDARSSPQA